jgi:rubrerythrin
MLTTNDTSTATDWTARAKEADHDLTPLTVSDWVERCFAPQFAEGLVVRADSVDGEECRIVVRSDRRYVSTPARVETTFGEVEVFGRWMRTRDAVDALEACVADEDGETGRIEAPRERAAAKRVEQSDACTVCGAPPERHSNDEGGCPDCGAHPSAIASTGPDARGETDADINF